mmetsp:Transcript_2803/g.6417  ORF Transcript_2803/g.6417 Transcript_2803/m.6417 type:complete len:101 (-) Transcript_2803:2232-2534(-)
MYVYQPVGEWASEGARESVSRHFGHAGRQAGGQGGKGAKKRRDVTVGWPPACQANPRSIIFAHKTAKKQPCPRGTRHPIFPAIHPFIHPAIQPERANEIK